MQTLKLCVCLRVSVLGTGGADSGQIAVPVLERDIKIRVNVSYGARRFVASNWQWLIGTAITLGGGLAAWVAFIH